MDKEFAEKVVLVTGATSGIGRATALRFAAAGARIAAVGRKQEALTDLTREANRQNLGEILAISADLTADSQAERIVAEASRNFGGIDVLVNAAGHISSGTIETSAVIPSMLPPCSTTMRP